MKTLTTILTLCGLLLLMQPATGQALLNKMKSKMEAKAAEAVDKALSGGQKNAANSTNLPAGSENTLGNGNSNSNSNSGIRNKGGAGLVSTPPDVKQNLNNAEVTYKTGKFGDTRAAIQQAMLGVELEIGQQILKSLPETISGLKKDEKVERVASAGYGWAGLTIQRNYNDANDKEFRVMVANNAALMSAFNMYLANGTYAQSSGQNQNWKQTTYKGNKAIIEYSNSEGYKLTVPIGQSSFMVYEGVNFKDEKELLTAANTVDIDKVKKMLGEK